MHPTPAFRADDAALRALVEDVAFAHIFAATPDGPMVAHAPVVLTAEGALRFHLARPNRLTRHLAGARAVASIVDAGSYISPDWYADPAGNVPTWNYRAAEVEGAVRPLDEAELLAQLDALAAAWEPRVGARWTRAKLPADRQAALLRGITGFELAGEARRGTWKASQNKSAADRAGVRAALAALGSPAAEWVA